MKGALQVPVSIQFNCDLTCWPMYTRGEMLHGSQTSLAVVPPPSGNKKPTLQNKSRFIEAGKMNGC